MYICSPRPFDIMYVQHLFTVLLTMYYISWMGGSSPSFAINNSTKTNQKRRRIEYVCKYIQVPSMYISARHKKIGLHTQE